LAERALRDTVAVTVAARHDPIVAITRSLPPAARWAVAGHVLDFDDLHLPSTTHISVVCVPASLGAGGAARGYLAGAGVMARIGTLLGWGHYTRGWHATCTAGAFGAAAAAGIGLGLDDERLATALALAVPAAGGVQRAFGSQAKSLQVGFAVQSGIRAARLAADGAGADLRALDDWLGLVADSDRPGSHDENPAVPGGLAIKIYPACYALQRPIAAVAGLVGNDAGPAFARQVTGVRVRTPAATVAPLIHHRPSTGLQGKFSLQYAVATALLDAHPGFAAFTDEAVRRPDAQRLIDLVETELTSGSTGLLDGRVEVELRLRDGRVLADSLDLPPGAPARPPTPADLQAKISDCLVGVDTDPAAWTWPGAATLLANLLND
jgi:2-methylcitrate dehydratase PrpD